MNKDQIILTDDGIIIKPFSPGRRTAMLHKDGEVSIVNNPTVEELTETIKILASMRRDEESGENNTAEQIAKSLEAISDKSQNMVDVLDGVEATAAMMSKEKIHKWEDVKKELGIEDKPKIFPNDGTANELIWHRINEVNKSIRVFALTDPPLRKLKVQLNNTNYMVLLPFKCKKKDAKKILFEVSDGTWEINNNKYLQVIWYNNELIGIITVKNPDNGGVSLSFYKAHYLTFQNGAEKDFGVNGFTNEALLAILMDRFANNSHNGTDDKVIIDLLQSVRLWIYKRTLDKRAIPIEGA